MKYGKALYQAIFGQHKCEPFSGWLKVEVNLMFPHTKKSDKLAMERVPMTLKPDFDNAVKVPVDAMVDEGLIDNDAHIYDGRCVKWHSDIEGISVTIEEHGL
jgi:Holliday junction resolvase RusA-like endonuclease